MTRLIAALFALALILTACGGDDDTPDSDSSGELPVNNGAEPPAEDPVNEPGDEPAEPEPDQDLPLDGDEPLGAGPYPIADLTVTYDHPDTGSTEYRIVCLGDTATLTGGPEGVTDQSACAALARDDVQARLIEGVPEGQVCTEQYGGPETARFVGTIDDQPVDTIADRANGCGISDWDSVLVDLLPAPRPFG